MEAFAYERGGGVELAHADATLRGTVDTGAGSLTVALYRLPDYAEPRDRAEAWAQDLEVVRTRFLRFDRSFPPAARKAVKKPRGLRNPALENCFLARKIQTFTAYSSALSIFWICSFCSHPPLLSPSASRSLARVSNR